VLCRTVWEFGEAGSSTLVHNLVDGTVVTRVFETQDVGNPGFLDLYEFGPLNEALGQDEADEIVSFPALDDCLVVIEQRWHGSSSRLVNEGVLQNEYADFVAGRAG